MCSSSIPTRIFTVTGTPASPAVRTAVDTIASNSRRLNGSAEPPPRRVTLGTGQPKFRSMWSARSSSTTIRTAAPTTVGSTPYSCSDRGYSPGSNRIIAIVLRSRSTRARVVIISQTYSPPAPSGWYGRAELPHRRRNDEFVIPAIGASTTGGDTAYGPMRRGAVPGEGASTAVRTEEVTGPLSPVRTSLIADFRSGAGTNADVGVVTAAETGSGVRSR